MKRILLVDSDPVARRSIRDRLTADGHVVLEFDSAEQARSSGESVDTILLCYAPGDMPADGASPGQSPAILGLRELSRAYVGVPVIVVCNSAEETLHALREGAYYVTRYPLSADEASLLVARALSGDERSSPRSETQLKAATPQFVRPLAPASEPEPLPILLGESPKIKAIRRIVERLGERPTTTVLITGESGSGKDMIARILHAQTSQGGSFVDLSALNASDASLETLLFGVEASGEEARPGLLEQADQGTLFLGDICELSLPLQTKLLRFVQERTFRRLGSSTDIVSQARVVATSTRNLDDAVRDGLLRPEFAYRLAVVMLEVPPLRERKTDIPLLVEHFIAQMARTTGASVRALSEGAMKRLMNHSWPGNVRELFNVVEGAALICNGEVVDETHLPPLSSPRSGVDYRLPSQGIAFCDLEREVLTQALRLAAGNQTRAASLLGLTRDQMRYRMAKFGLSSRDTASDRAA